MSKVEQGILNDEVVRQGGIIDSGHILGPRKKNDQFSMLNAQFSKKERTKIYGIRRIIEEDGNVEQ